MSALTISRNEACTVVSVIPYMLTKRGSTGWRSIHGFNRCGSRASPPNTTTSIPSCPARSGAIASTVCRA
ncbi:Uncharacterised protein [Mycobacteroides abscessus subsp. abscessus]|nr:Uncharacterised protein [Mycobacteroides abscessus subsp. abscessus]